MRRFYRFVETSSESVLDYFLRCNVRTFTLLYGIKCHIKCRNSFRKGGDLRSSKNFKELISRLKILSKGNIFLSRIVFTYKKGGKEWKRKSLLKIFLHKHEGVLKKGLESNDAREICVPNWRTIARNREVWKNQLESNWTFVIS